jgi:hypothetical protein
VRGGFEYFAAKVLLLYELVVQAALQEACMAGITPRKLVALSCLASLEGWT